MAAATDVRAVATAFGLDDLQGEPNRIASGEQGDVWAVTTTRGRWAIKRLSSERAPDRIADAVAFAAAAGSRIPMPVSLVLADGSAFLDGAEVGEPGTWFRGMEWLDLDANGGVEPHDLGRLAASIHRIDCPAARDVEPWFAHGIDDDTWEALLDAARAAQVDWIDGLRRRIPALVRLRALATARPGRPLTSHRDLNLSNLRRTRSGDVVVLDWDLCGPADPRRELALALVQLEVTHSGSAVPAYRAYVAAGGPARVDAPDAFAAVSISLDNLIHHYATQLLADAPPGRAQDRMAWLFDAADLATLPWLERLLARLQTVDG